MKHLLNYLIYHLWYGKPFRKDSNIYLYFLNELIKSSSLNIIVVGANDGKINGPIYEFAMANKKRTNLLLIEPQKEFIPFLEENYRTRNSTLIINEAIGKELDISLFRVKPMYWQKYKSNYLKDAPYYRVPSGFTSSTRAHVINHAMGNLENDLGIDECIEEIIVPCSNLRTIVDRVSWNKVDVLQVDAEGNDDIVLYASNIDSLEPKIIRYEKNHIGISRNEALSRYLKNQGYHLKEMNEDMLALRFI
jgi:FkbM family methyltransferase